MQYKDVSYKYLFPHENRKKVKSTVSKVIGVKEGDIVTVKMSVATNNVNGKTESAKNVRAVVDGIYPYFVLLHTQFDYNRCMLWDDFHRARLDKPNAKQK